MVSAFWQVPVSEPDIHKTGFCTPFGNFEWLRMPFGLVNASSTFQRLMDGALDGIDLSYPYIDDIFVYSKEWGAHMQQLRVVLARMRDIGLRLKLPKCIFAAPAVKCLGYIVNEQGITTNLERVAPILGLSRPTTTKDVRSFLGMVAYYARFIPEFARIAAPLHALTHKGQAFVWSAGCEEAFQALKGALATEPVLRLPSWELVYDDNNRPQLKHPFHLHTDWSETAMGAVLSQINEAGEDHPIAFGSKLCSPAESKYSASEGECCALTWAFAKFRHYIHGYHFTVRTDHEALEWLASARYKNAKLERWALRLQEFDFSVQYKKGCENVVADCLSRLPPEGSLLPVSAAAVWPEYAKTQVELDRIPCEICNNADAWDNMVICDGCDRCMHLRCLIPPQTSAPSGQFFCPACDMGFENSVAELADADTPLRHNSGHDPHLNEPLIKYLCSGRSEATLPLDCRARQAVLSQAIKVRLHHRYADWLVLYKKIRHGSCRWLCCPSLQYRWDIIRLFHEALGHAGVAQTLTVMHQHFHWTGIKSDIGLYVQACDACQRSKLVHLDLPDLQVPAVYGPLWHVHVDLAGPFRTSQYNPAAQGQSQVDDVKAWIVVMVDYFTKVAELVLVYSKEPLQVAQAFYTGWVCRYGTPPHVTTDNGKEFATDFGHMLARLGVEHITTSVRHPAANGAVERLIKSVKDILTKHINNHSATWLKALPTVRMAYMNRIHSAIKMSPNEMLMGFKPELPLPVADVLRVAALDMQDPSPSDAAEYVKELNNLFAELDVHALIEIENQFHRNAYDWIQRQAVRLGRVSDELQAGDLVLELDTIAGPLRGKARGPYLVKSVQPNGVVTLTSGSTEFKDKRDFDRNIGLLAKYYDKQSIAANNQLQ